MTCAPLFYSPIKMQPGLHKLFWLQKPRESKVGLVIEHSFLRNKFNKSIAFSATLPIKYVGEVLWLAMRKVTQYILYWRVCVPFLKHK